MDTESAAKPPKKTLLEKYEIPVEFLDFSYIKECSDVKTIERIVKILRSGEEGFYPDLTKCAEDKLRELKPHSKLFRVELPVLKKENLEEGKRSEIEESIKNFVSEMKIQDSVVKEIKPQENKQEPPIRKKRVEKSNSITSKTPERIKSTDYSKWDKFDADAEVLKIDLDEERQREIVAVKNQKNIEKKQLIEVIEDTEVDNMPEFERERLSLKFKERGNEAYKAKDYDEAIKEYTQSIRLHRNAAAFNNRALVYLKVKKFIKVISDTNECLRMEPTNVKALIRKGQAFLGEHMLTEAHDTFEKVLQIDGTNEIAQREMIQLQRKMPAKNAFRMKIEEVDECKEKVPARCEKLDLPEAAHVPKLVQNIVVEELTPFDKLKPKESKPREKLLLPNDLPQKKSSSLIQEIN